MSTTERQLCHVITTAIKNFTKGSS